jgi:hypothetical protein
MHFYNFTNGRFYILQHQLGKVLGNFNYIGQKWIHFKPRISQKTDIFVILYVYAHLKMSSKWF